MRGCGGDGGSVCFGVIGVPGFDDLLLYGCGNAPRTALPGTISMSEVAEPLRLGVGGAVPSFGGASLEAIRGVNECERTCV